MDYQTQQTPVQSSQPFQQSAQYSAQTPPPSKPFFANPVVLVFIVVVVAILASFGTYFVLQSKTSKPIPAPVATKPVVYSPTPTPDPTANWQVYTNTQFNYSIKYPTSWIIREKDGGKRLVEVSPPTVTVSPQDLSYVPAVSISVLTRPFSTSQQITTQQPTPSELKQITVDGVTGYSMKLNSCAPRCPTLTVELPFDKGSGTLDLATFTQDTTIFNQILSTFKFTDQNQALNLSELNGFPIYPDAKFVKKNQAEPCPNEPVSGYSFCGLIVYEFESTDDFDKINTWYTKDVSNSGWECNGGAGSYAGPRDATGTQSCRKGYAVYQLSLDALSSKTTINIGIK